MIDWNPIAEKFREADAILIGAVTACPSPKDCICLQIMQPLMNCLEISNKNTDYIVFCRA